jgi:hypothetical protein
LQAKEAEIDPWTQADIDLLGTWILMPISEKIQSNALNCINPATGLFENVKLSDKTAESIIERYSMIDGYANILDPPQMIHFDNGNELKAEFMQICRNYGLKGKLKKLTG